MAADNTLKKLLNFDFRATFYKQTANGMLDEKVIAQNIHRLHKVKEKFIDTPSEDPLDIYNLIQRLRSYYESNTSTESLDFKFKELRLISYNIPRSDFKFCRYIIQILKNKWYVSYNGGLIHTLLRNWNQFELDIKSMLIDELKVHIKTSSYSEILPYLSDNGAYQLGYKICKENRNIYDCCKSFKLASNRISYSYFTGVLRGYYETSSSVNYEELGQILLKHNNTLADKLILSRLIVQQYDKSNIPYQLFNLAMERIGDPYINSLWATPDMATREETDIINSARKIMIMVISSRVINVFFNSLCNDTSRLNFWLKRTSEIQDFKVYGSVDSRNIVSSRLNNSIVNSKFNLVGGKSDNCALVMHIEDYVIVEFSGGGALYVYLKRSRYYNEVFNKKIEKIDDLKQPYIPQLINLSYDYMNMNPEGRLVHSGNWQYRLDRWFKKQINK